MKIKVYILSAIMIFAILSANATEIYVSPNGSAKSKGTLKDPVSFEVAIQRASTMLKREGVPKDGIHINVLGGYYRFETPIQLGEEFKGSENSPIVIKAVDGAEVLFDGSMMVNSNDFTKVTEQNEIVRLAKNSVDHILVATITNKAMIKRFNQSLLLNLSFNGKNYLPSVFPNKGYSYFKEETIYPEVTPPAVPVGKEDHGVRAGHVPYLEPGKNRAWKGSLEEPRGASACFDKKGEEMAGTWQQWEDELKRNNSRNQLTGFIEASWLLSSQPIYAASAKDKCVQLSRALAYGWAWRKNDKPFRVFGMLCEIDSPGEWHFDPLTNRLFVYPPESLTEDTEVNLSVADGFLDLNKTQYVQVIGLSVTNVGSGDVYRMSGENNLIAACKIMNSTATGVNVDGRNNSVVGCDLVDLNMHARLSGGVANETEITAANNRIENCNIYQKQFKHEKVNIGMTGVGNIFRNNLVHNSIGQAMIVNGNDQLIELNEFFNIGFEEGDGGAVYSGADLGGFGNVYRYNFFHHLMHCPGKVSRAGLHLDDGQSGATVYGNLFYKSAAKGVFMFGGAGHTVYDNVLLEGERGIYMCQVLGEKYYHMSKEISADPNHHRRGTKEDYIGRVEARIGSNGWTNSLWKEKYPLFNEIMCDTAMYGRLWPIRYTVTNNFAFGNKNNKISDYRVEAEALAKCEIEEYNKVSPSDFMDYDNLNLVFKNKENFPNIPFREIGLKKDKYRTIVPDKTHYRKGIKDFFKGIGSMPGTKKQIDTAVLVEESIKD